MKRERGVLVASVRHSIALQLEESQWAEVRERALRRRFAVTCRHAKQLLVPKGIRWRIKLTPVCRTNSLHALGFVERKFIRLFPNGSNFAVTGLTCNRTLGQDGILNAGGRSFPSPVFGKWLLTESPNFQSPATWGKRIV